MRTRDSAQAATRQERSIDADEPTFLVIDEVAQQRLELNRAVVLMPSFTWRPEWSIRLDETRDFEACVSGMIDETVEILYRRQIIPETGYSRHALKKVLRPHVALVTYTLADRVLRLCRLLRYKSLQEAAFPFVGSFEPPEDYQDLYALARDSWEFNQFILGELVPWLGRKDKACKSVMSQWKGACRWRYHEGFLRAESQEEGIFWTGFLGKLRNHLSNPRPAMGRLKDELLSLVTYGGDVAAFCMMYHEACLLKKGFYWPLGRLRYIRGRGPRIASKAADRELRERAAKETGRDFVDLYRRFVRNLSSGGPGEELIVPHAAGVFFKLFPKSCIESLKEHCDFAITELRRFKGKHYVSCSMASTRSGILYNFAATEFGLKIWAVQHSAWGGHIANHAESAESDIVGCDYFISSGWSHKEEHLPSWRDKVFPMPSIHYSALRKERKRRNNAGAGNSRCVLICPGFTFPFPHIYSGFVRRDTWIDWKDALSDAISALASKGIHMKVKLYSPLVAEVAEVAVREWLEAGKGWMEVIPVYEKGVARTLFDQAQVVVWDIPSSGFAEALALKKPTLVLWSEKLIRCQAEARPLLERLIGSGVFCRDGASLARSCENFFESREWWLEAKRQTAIRDFLHNYVRIQEDWPVKWRQFMNQHWS